MSLIIAVQIVDGYKYRQSHKQRQKSWTVHDSWTVQDKPGTSDPPKLISYSCACWGIAPWCAAP